MQFKRQIKAEESVNLTPLIDVVFLLLIFFMVSTTFTKESHLKVDLPEAKGISSTNEKTDQIEVIVDSQGGYSINGQALVNNQTATLVRALNDIQGDKSTIPFIITGDANASYQSVITLMDVAGQLGFVNIRMTAQTPPEAANE